MSVSTRSGRWLLPAIVTVLLLPACSEGPPGSGSIDGMELGLQTELHLKKLVAATPPDASTVEYARSLFRDPPLVDSLRVYTASAEIDDELTELTLWVLPLGPELDDGKAVAALDDTGAMLRSRIWGSDDLDSDPEASWENFWRQIEYRGSRSTIPSGIATSDAAVDEYISQLRSDTSATITNLLYEHRLAMYASNYIIRRTFATSRGEHVPPLEWLRSNQTMYSRLGEIAEGLTPLIGDSAVVSYKAVLGDGQAILDRVVSEAAIGNGDAVRNQVGTFRRQTCGNCHGIENHRAGEGELKQVLFTQLQDLGVRNDLYRTGLDIWAVPGEETRSQQIANVFKAIMVIAGA